MFVFAKFDKSISPERIVIVPKLTYGHLLKTYHKYTKLACN